MADIKMRYLTVMTDVMPEGFSMQCWMAVERPHPIDLIGYENTYTYMGETCTWLIFSSSELTPKLLVMLGEQADRICIAGQKSAQNRKVANR